MIELINLTKYYGEVLGCKDINFKLEKGEIFGFIGPNGAGKSTTIRCIMNLINKTEGKTVVDGIETSDKNYKLKARIGYLPSDINIYEDLTVQEMINYNDSFYQKSTLKKAKALVKELNVDIKKKIDELSFGNLKKLGIILALAHDPDYIIMDEATNGLDPLMQEKFYEILLHEQAKGKTILFSSHNLSEVKRLCKRVAIIKDGSIVALNETSNLAKTNFLIVSLHGKIKDIAKKIEIKPLDTSHDYLKFIYQGEVNDLINVLNDYKITKLLIEEPSIEEIFMHYYV